MTSTSTRHHRSPRTAIAAAVAAAAIVLGAAGLAGADDSGRSPGASEDAGGRADVGTAAIIPVVAVRGGYGDGFTVVRLDGARRHLPSLSESMAECSEYRARVKKARCWAEVETHYDDLAEMKRAINYQKKLRRQAQHGHGGHGGR